MKNVSVTIDTKNMFRNDLRGGSPRDLQRKLPTLFLTNKQIYKAQDKSVKKAMRMAQSYTRKKIKAIIKLPTPTLKKRVQASNLKASSRRAPTLFIGEDSILVEATKFRTTPRFKARNPYIGKLQPLANTFASPKNKDRVYQRLGKTPYPIKRATWHRQFWGANIIRRDILLSIITKFVADQANKIYQKELEKLEKKK